MEQHTVATPQNPEEKIWHPASERLVDPLSPDLFLRLFGWHGSKMLARELVNALLAATETPEIDSIQIIRASSTDDSSIVTCTAPGLGLRLVLSDRPPYPVSAQRSADAGLELIRNENQLAHDLAIGKGHECGNPPRIVVVMLREGPPVFPDRNEVVARCPFEKNVDASCEGNFKVQFVIVELQRFRELYDRLTDEVLDNEALSWLYLLTKAWRNDNEFDAIMATYPNMEMFARLYSFFTKAKR